MASGKRRDVAADGDEQRFVKKQTLTRPVNEELSCNFGIQIMERGLQMDNDRYQEKKAECDRKDEEIRRLLTELTRKDAENAMLKEKCAKQKAKIAVLKTERSALTRPFEAAASDQSDRGQGR